MKEEDATFLKEQAEKCRWLAANSRDPTTVLTLRKMADEYEAQAAAPADRGIA